MKVLLMHPHRRFELEGPLPANAEQLSQDLGLATLVDAIADGDATLHQVAVSALLQATTITDPAVITYRQAVLRDCLEHPDVIDRLYRLALDAIANEHRQWRLTHGAPDSMIYRSLIVLKMFMDTLKAIRDLAERHAATFESEGFQRLFAMLREQLSDDYFGLVKAQIEALQRSTVLVSARLGSGNEGVGYTLRSPHPESLLERVSPFHHKGLTFAIDPRDESGARAISELRSRGLEHVANAVAQSADHILAFFESLRTELAFYIGAGHLLARLQQLDVATCVPTPMADNGPRLSAQGLYDPALALRRGAAVVGNDLHADGRTLLIITGANQGGKSTFLRAVGIAQLMLQAGLFVAAQSFSAEPRDGLFTHFKREEDASMQSGKLDEELERMEDIVARLTPAGMLLCNESFSSTNEREGSEISRQVLGALTEAGVKIAFVTHLFDLTHGLAREPHEHVLFLRAARGENGERTFEISEAEPLATSFAQDTYEQVFGEVLR